MVDASFHPEQHPGEDMENRARPVLAYTRKYGWIVVRPWRGEPRPELFGLSRPGHVIVWQHQVLAVEPLPPPPDSAT